MAAKKSTKKKYTSEIVELTMSLDYVAQWTTKHGIREVVQNAMDAEKILGHEMKIIYDSDLLRLHVVTSGVCLEKKTLLLGVSEKGGEGAIGQYGEGYKVGVLAMIRDGKRVEIRTGDQMWKPRLERSESFGVPTLQFEIESGHERYEGIDVRIHGIVPNEWKEYCQMFERTSNWTDSAETRLLPYWASDKRTTKCRVLYDSEQKGRLYVGGIYVMTNPELLYGYDLPPEDFKLDRDRDNVRSYELNQTMAVFWQSVFVDAFEAGDVHKQKSLIDKFASVEKEFSQIKVTVRAKFVDCLVELLKSQHGTDMFPVSDYKSMQMAREAGIVATMIKEPIYSFVSSRFPSLVELAKEKKQEVVRSWSSDSLELDDKASLMWAWRLVRRAAKKRYPKILMDVPIPQVAEFHSDDIEGVNAGGLIFVSRSVIKDKGRLVVTLVHEYVHQMVERHGEAMLAACEQLYEEIITELMLPVEAALLGGSGDEQGDEAAGSDVQTASDEAPDNEILF